MALALRPAGPPSNPPPNRMLQQIQGMNRSCDVLLAAEVREALTI